MSTTNSIGTAARNFSTSQAWEDAVPATPTGGYIGEHYNDSEFTAGVSIAGHTTSAADFIRMTCAAGQSFQDNAGVRTNPLFYDQTKGVGIAANPFGIGVIDVQNDWVQVLRLQVKRTGTSYSRPAIDCIGDLPNGVVKDCIALKTGNDATYVVHCRGTPCTNVLAVDTGGGASTGFGVAKFTAATKLLNCTSVRDSALGAGGTGFEASATYVNSIAVNCASFGWTTGFTATGWDTTNSGFNCADDASPPGGNAQASKTYANQFVSTSNDFRLKTGSDCIDHGNTDATLAPNDISGTARGVGTAGDIGVWEFVAAAATGGDSVVYQKRGGRGPGTGPSMRRMAPQQFPTPAPIDTVTPAPTATPFHIGGGIGAKGIPQRRRIPQQFPDTIPFVPDGSASQTPFRIGRGGGVGAPMRRMFPQQYPTAAITNVTVALTGASATFSAGALGLIHTQALIGAAATFAAGSVKATLSRTLAGAQGTFSAGSVKAALAKALLGQKATFTSGIVSSALSKSLTGASAIFGPGTVVPVTGFVMALTGARAQFSSGLLAAVAQSVQTQFSGGYREYAHLYRRRAEEELRREREQWGILPKVAQIVSAVAIRQADTLDLDAEQRLEELERELELAGVAYQTRYFELLNLQRQRLIDAEIRGYFEAQEALDEENKRRLLFLIAFL
jgi:hypothetical protein